MEIGNDYGGSCTMLPLDLFAPRLRQEEIVRGAWEKITPTNSIDNINPVIEFLIKGNNMFIDLNNCYIETKFRIKNSNNSNLADDAVVSIINYFGATLFNQVEMYLNNDHIATVDNYAYRAYFESLLSFNGKAKKSWLQAGLFYKDTHRHHDTLTDENTGFRYRKSLINQSRSVEMMSKIHCDLFNQCRMLLNQVNVKLIFTRNSDTFCLMAANTATVKIEIEEISLFVRRSTLADHKFTEINNTINKQDAKYFIPRVRVKTFTCAAGQRNVEIRNQLSAPDLPTRIVIGMVSNAVYSGQKALNPFNFQHYNVSSVNITVDSKCVFAKPLSINMTNGNYLQAYWNLMLAMGYIGKNEGCDITRNEYDNGYFLLAADLTSTLCDGTYDDPIQTGNLDVELTFSDALPETITVLIYAEYENVITINAMRKAIPNFK